jgi:hypothetical protein
MLFEPNFTLPTCLSNTTIWSCKLLHAVVFKVWVITLSLIQTKNFSSVVVVSLRHPCFKFLKGFMIYLTSLPLFYIVFIFIIIFTAISKDDLYYCLIFTIIFLLFVFLMFAFTFMTFVRNYLLWWLQLAV